MKQQMKQQMYVMFLAVALFATGVLAEHPSLGLANSEGVLNDNGDILDQIDGHIDAPVWVSNAAIPQSGGLSQSSTTASGDGTALYEIGGGIGSALTPTSVVRKYDTLTDMWSTVAPVPQSPGIRSFGSAVNIGGTSYVFGGYDGISPLNTTWIYDEGPNAWHLGANMPGARFGPAVATSFTDSVIWVIGGFDGSFAATNTVWAYNPSTNTWATGFAPMPLFLGRIHGVETMSGEVHVFAGGFDGVDHRVYNTIANSWSAAALMPFGVTDPATVYLSCTGKIYLAGGGGFAPRGQGHTQIFDPMLGTWSQGPLMPAPALDNTSGVLLGATFYVEAGYDGVGSVTNNYSLDLTP